MHHRATTPKGKEFDEAVPKRSRAPTLRVLDMEILIDPGGAMCFGTIIDAFRNCKGMGAFEVLSYEGPFGVGYMVAQ